MPAMPPPPELVETLAGELPDGLPDRDALAARLAAACRAWEAERARKWRYRRERGEPDGRRRHDTPAML